MTPGEAIRKFCVECVGGSTHATKDCTGDRLYDDPCLFYKFRNGKGKPSVKNIRKECLKCMGGSSQLVKDCATEKCPLHIFRFGKNPNVDPSRAKNLRKNV